MTDTMTQIPDASIFTGESVDEATATGLRALGLDDEEAEVRVLDKGSRGFLGFGSRSARVAILPRLALAGAVEDIARGILSRMGVEATVQAAQTGLEVDVTVDCPGADGLLIGRRGETLDAFQHVLLRMAARRSGGKLRDVRVDVAGYRDRREDQLRKDAMALAERVVRSGRRGMTEPLSPAERRVVHRALEKTPGVKTHVTGTGANRRVVVTPARGEGD